MEIVQDLDAGAPAVLRDPTQVHQVLLNLCTNPEHAMRPKGGTLRVALAPRDVGPEEAERLGSIEPRAYAVLTVSDAGCGMSPETRDRLFEPFLTTKPTGEGTGMGLATSHGIVASYGGAITVEGEVGAGATFRVYLPARRGRVGSRRRSPPPLTTRRRRCARARSRQEQTTRDGARRPSLRRGRPAGPSRAWQPRATLPVCRPPEALGAGVRLLACPLFAGSPRFATLSLR